MRKIGYFHKKKLCLLKIKPVMYIYVFKIARIFWKKGFSLKRARKYAIMWIDKAAQSNNKLFKISYTIGYKFEEYHTDADVRLSFYMISYLSEPNDERISKIFMYDEKVKWKFYKVITWLQLSICHCCLQHVFFYCSTKYVNREEMVHDK